jgi:hypothetical protein
VVTEGKGRYSSSNVHGKGGGEGESRCSTKVDVVGGRCSSRGFVVRSRAGQAWQTKHARAKVVLRLAGAGPTRVRARMLLTCKRDRSQRAIIAEAVEYVQSEMLSRMRRVAEGAVL